MHHRTAPLLSFALSLGCSTASPVGDSRSPVPPIELDAYTFDTGGADTASSTEPESSCPQPVAPISLAEAWNRGFADIWFDNTLKVANDGPYPVRIDDWHIYFAEGSQDAAAGHTDFPHGEPGGDTSTLILPPGEVWEMAYTGSDGPAWWCIERTQRTAPTSNFHFNGAEVPDILKDFILFETDEDGNGVEDHTEVPPREPSVPQTQHNLWDTIAAGPVFVVGRVPNYLELQPGQSEELTIEVVNLGRGAGSMVVTETLPAGTSASDFSVLPTTEERHEDGSTTYTWSDKVLASVDDDDLAAPTDYATVQIRYTLTWDTPACGMRVTGDAPHIDWSDVEARPQRSSGTELVIACCP